MADAEFARNTTPTPSDAYFPPDPLPSTARVDSVMSDRSEYMDVYGSISPKADVRSVSHRSRGSTVPVCSGMMSSVAAARPPPPLATVTSPCVVHTLPKLELKEPTVVVTIIEVRLPWLFWVQPRKQELDDILDKLECVDDHFVLAY